MISAITLEAWVGHKNVTNQLNPCSSFWQNQKCVTLVGLSSQYKISVVTFGRVGRVSDGGTILHYQDLNYECTKKGYLQLQILHLLCLLIPSENTFEWLTASSALSTNFSFGIASFQKYQSNVGEISSVCFARQIGFGYPCKFSGSFDQILHPLANLEFMPNIASSSEISKNSFMWTKVVFLNSYLWKIFCIYCYKCCSNNLFLK